MARDLERDRLDTIIEYPWELAEYERWLERTQRPGDDYLFGERRVRFSPREQDLLVGAPGLGVHCDGTTIVLTSDAGSVTVADATCESAERFVAALAEPLPLAALRDLGIPDAELFALFRAAFGAVVFAPERLAELERRVSGVEVARFVGSPYEIERPYWENVGAVRAELAAAGPLLEHPARAPRLFQRLHVLALLGADRRNFYRPASPIAARGTRPGAWFEGEVVLIDTPRGALLVEGPRVNVGFIGGKLYHRALYEVVGDPAAAEPRTHEDDGLDWGRVVLARAPGETKARSWFLPPRPLTPAHFEATFAPLAEARQPGAELFTELARFHQRFVRLHPFRCANQSLAMAAVNQVLTEQRGAGMPHLILDQLALRLTPAAYARVFAAAARTYAPSELDPAARYRELAARRDRAFGFITRVAGASTLAEALAVVAAELETARLALFAA